MNQRDEKLKLVREIIEFIETRPYDPENCAQYVYIKSLDARAYRYEDKKLNTLLDLISGMSAGEEFFCKRSVKHVLPVTNHSVTCGRAFRLASAMINPVSELVVVSGP